MLTRSGLRDALVTPHEIRLSNVEVRWSCSSMICHLIELAQSASPAASSSTSCRRSGAPDMPRDREQFSGMAVNHVNFHCQKSPLRAELYPYRKGGLL
jgi:hypothetical protein